MCELFFSLLGEALSSIVDGVHSRDSFPIENRKALERRKSTPARGRKRKEAGALGTRGDLQLTRRCEVRGTRYSYLAVLQL